MNGIIPLGYSRVSQPLITGRELWGAQSQLGRLTGLELQLMTQQQYQLGSESPWKATQAVSIQMLMERKTQSVTNLTITQSFLSATDSTLAKVSNMAIDARGNAVKAVQTTTSATERLALAEEVKAITQSIFNLANTQYLDRYLFAGSATATLPFVWGSDSYSVKYAGNETQLNTWGDLGVLTQSNSSGVAVFGAVSEAVRGATNLNPTLQPETLLSTLNGGKGIELGKIRISYENNGKITSSDIDLSRCATVDDVRKAIAKNQPVGAVLHVELSDNALKIGLSPNVPGSITITEIGQGKTAQTLGIHSKTPIPSGTMLTGRNLNPAVTKTTGLDAICGSKAKAYLQFAGDNNDIVLQAVQNGATITDANGKTWDMNGIEIAILSDAVVPRGRETVTYDEAAKRITIHTHPDLTTASDIINAINSASQAGIIPPLVASSDSVDQTGRAGSGMVPFAPGTPVLLGTTAYGSGEPFDQSGLQIVNDNKIHVLDFSECVTIGDLLNELNDNAIGLMASINASGTGIDVRSRVSGADFTIGENGGGTATQLGLRTCTASTLLNQLDYNRGVVDYDGPGTNAWAQYESKSANSALLITAKDEGTVGNDYTVHFVPTTDPDGRVLVSWDQDAKSITIGINSGVTKACEIVAAFNEQVGPRDMFTMTLDDTNGTNTGLGVVYEGTTRTAGGENGGIDFIITRRDGVRFEIDIKGARTVQDVIDIINNHPENTDATSATTSQMLVAQLAQYGNGIELIDLSVGLGETRVQRTLLSTAAISLGLVNEGEEYSTNTYPGMKATGIYDSGTLNSILKFSGNCSGEYANGVKIQFVDTIPNGNPNSTGFTWDSTTQTLTFEIDAGVTTANDVIALFKNNASAELRLMFDLQNGLNVDGTISNGSGLVALTSSGSEPTLTGGENATLKGNDPNPLETKSLFNALIRLQVAMQNNDVREIERASKLLDEAAERISFSREDIGIRQHAIDTLASQIADEDVQLKTALQSAFGIDESEVILNYSNALVAYEASLKVTSTLMQLSLINYI